MAEIKCFCKVCEKDFFKQIRRGNFEVCPKCQNKKRCKEWLLKHPEAKKHSRQPSKEAKQRYAKSERGMQNSREKSHRWYWKNPEYARLKNRERYAKDRDKAIQRTVNRSKRLRQATPPWANLEKIAEIYKEARRLTRETGIEYQVDHIIPLLGKNVCGLHVEHNLQILTAEANKKKSNLIIVN